MISCTCKQLSAPVFILLHVYRSIHMQTHMHMWFIFFLILHGIHHDAVCYIFCMSKQACMIARDDTGQLRGVSITKLNYFWSVWTLLARITWNVHFQYNSLQCHGVWTLSAIQWTCLQRPCVLAPRTWLQSNIDVGFAHDTQQNQSMQPIANSI